MVSKLNFVGKSKNGRDIKQNINSEKEMTKKYDQKALPVQKSEC